MTVFKSIDRFHLQFIESYEIITGVIEYHLFNNNLITFNEAKEISSNLSKPIWRLSKFTIFQLLLGMLFTVVFKKSIVYMPSYHILNVDFAIT